MEEKTYQVSGKKRRPKKAYDFDMWKRKCPKGVQSCFKVTDFQRLSFQYF